MGGRHSIYGGKMLAPVHSRQALAESVCPYTFRRAEVADISAINGMLVDEYGPSYPYPLRELAVDGIYIVATHEPTAEIVGFSRAAPLGGHEGVYELGGLIVKRSHRGHDVAKRMTIERMNEARERGAKVAMSEPVCYRIDCASQLNLLGFGFVLLGIQPAKYPDIQGEILQGQPESVLMAACWLQGKSGFGTRKIYLPREYRGTPHNYLPREIHSKRFEEKVQGVMPSPVHHAGRMGVGCRGAEYIDVPANWKESESLIAKYMQQGYRFSCLLPGFGDLDGGSHFDYVRLYRLPDTVHGFDFRRVHVASQLQPLKYFIAGEHACRR
ncbi:GNAT family N-acetyltransferase [Candidatus Uhrbacteria bacterium]|nr:GNAT family N-acetyltransferase [Candidatus Uhrbacteria bacterium]